MPKGAKGDRRAISETGHRVNARSAAYGPADSAGQSAVAQYLHLHLSRLFRGLRLRASCVASYGFDSCASISSASRNSPTACETARLRPS